MMSIFPLIIMLFFGAGPTSGNDFLDMVPSTAYWQAKGITPAVDQLQQDAAIDKPPESVDKLIKDLSADDFKTRDEARKKLESIGPAAAPLLKPATESKDPEVAATASALLKEFSDRAQERGVRRLMAIRTLGERHEKGALPLLKGLSDSKEVFVADYSKRAVAEIEGTKLPPVDRRKELAGDLQLLPGETGMMAQGAGLPGMALTVDKLVDQMGDAANQGGPMGMPGGKQFDKKKMLTKITGKLLEVIDRVGNIRVDGVTGAMSQNIGPDGGWGIVVLRGKYNAAAMVAAIKAMAGADNGHLKASRDGNVDILEVEDEMTLLLPSNDLFILVAGKTPQDKAPVIEHVMTVLKGGKGTLGENKELAALMTTVDTGAPAWGVGKLNDAMRKEKTFEPFDTVTLNTKSGKEGISFTLTAQGSDAEKVKAAADDMTTNIQNTIAQGKQMAAQVKALQPMIDMLESIKVAAAGKSATMTGELKPSVLQAWISSMAPLFMMEMDMEDMTEPAPGGAAPASQP